MKKILYFKLKILAKLVIAKYKPTIIGITGSVGKTSTKEAIYSVLNDKFQVRCSSKNFNNEIGTPLTIIGYNQTPGKNIFRYIAIFFKAFGLILGNKKYPKILVLEMGADKPGDISYLTSIAKPDIAVISAIGPSHLEKFGSIKNIVKEKSKILQYLGIDGWAILNRDDDNLRGIIENSKYQIKTFGRGDSCDVKISDIKITKREEVYGTSFKIIYQGSEVPMFLPRVLGWQHAQAAAAASAVALALGMNLVEIGKNILDYKPARGRTNLIEGVKGTWLIDDTYNASPQSSKAALEILAEMPSISDKIAVFGDMLELGNLSEEGHRQVGKELYKLDIDYLYVIGERSRDIARGAKEAGMEEDRIYHFPRTMEAGVFLQDRIKSGDVVLIKGSRGSKMEQVVYEIMAKPWLADELLVGKVIK